MPRIRSIRRHRWLRPACAAGALLLALPAAGQDTGLRGALDGPAAASSILPPLRTAQRAAPGAAGIPAQEYRPVSPGALPDEGGSPNETGETPSTDQELFPVLSAPGAARRSSAAARQERDSAEEAVNTAARPEEEESDNGPVTDGIRVGTVNRTEGDILPLPLRTNERTEPIEGRLVRREEDPYDPLGLRVGTFTLFPSIEQGLTWTSNADNSPIAEEAVISETTLRLNAVSGWSRHRAELRGFATYQESLSGDEVSELEGGAEAILELDLADNLDGRAALSYTARRESASSPTIIAGVERQPLRHTIDGSLGLDKAFGKLRLGIEGEISRDQYGDARLENGDILSQSDRDSTLALMRLRGGYELSPALTPFLELEAGRRFYDEEHDSAGYARSANRFVLRGGVELDISEKLSGEASVGWVAEDFDDGRLETISGIEIAAALNWSPMRGTNVRLDGTTTVEGATGAGESGSLLYAGTLRVERELRSNLTGDIALGAAWRDYAGGGHDLVLSGEAALTWWLNRYAGLVGRARHERQTSSLPGRDYETTSLFMGLRLQR